MVVCRDKVFLIKGRKIILSYPIENGRPKITRPKKKDKQKKKCAT